MTPEKTNGQSAPSFANVSDHRDELDAAHLVVIEPSRRKIPDGALNAEAPFLHRASLELARIDLGEARVLRPQNFELLAHYLPDVVLSRDLLVAAPRGRKQATVLQVELHSAPLLPWILRVWSASLPPQPGGRGADLALIVMILSDAPPRERVPIPQGRASRDTPPDRSLLERARERLSDSARATGVDDSGAGPATNRRAGEAEGAQARVVDKDPKGQPPEGGSSPSSRSRRLGCRPVALSVSR